MSHNRCKAQTSTTHKRCKRKSNQEGLCKQHYKLKSVKNDSKVVSPKNDYVVVSSKGDSVVISSKNESEPRLWFNNEQELRDYDNGFYNPKFEYFGYPYYIHTTIRENLPLEEELAEVSTYLNQAFSDPNKVRAQGYKGNMIAEALLAYAVTGRLGITKPETMKYVIEFLYERRQPSEPLLYLAIRSMCKVKPDLIKVKLNTLMKCLRQYPEDEPIESGLKALQENHQENCHSANDKWVEAKLNQLRRPEAATWVINAALKSGKKAATRKDYLHQTHVSAL